MGLHGAWARLGRGDGAVARMKVSWRCCGGLLGCGGFARRAARCGWARVDAGRINGRHAQIVCSVFHLAAEHWALSERRKFSSEIAAGVAKSVPSSHLRPQLVFNCDLTQKISNPRRHRPRQYPFAVLRAPHQVNLEVVLRVPTKPISSHSATSSTLPFA